MVSPKPFDARHSSPPLSIWRTVLAAAALIIPTLVGYYVISYSSGGLYAPKDGVRPWAASRYETALDPAKTTPVRTLRDAAPPELKISWEETPEKYRELHIDFTTNEAAEGNPREIFEAGTNGHVSLPDGNEIQLVAIAIVLPEDGDWEKSRYASVVPDWYDPHTGEKLPRESWQKEVHASRDEPRVYLRVKNAGKAPIRWLTPDIYDSNTLVDITGSSSYSSSPDHGIFYVGLDIWHQAAVDVTVDFVFGESVTKELKLEKGTVVEFGQDAYFKLLEIFPYGHGSSSWGRGATRSTAHLPWTTGATIHTPRP